MLNTFEIFVFALGVSKMINLMRFWKIKLNYFKESIDRVMKSRIIEEFKGAELKY